MTSEGPNQCIDPAVCHDWHIFIIFDIMLLNLNYVSMYTVNNSAQDMKRSYEGGHFVCIYFSLTPNANTTILLLAYEQS